MSGLSAMSGLSSNSSSVNEEILDGLVLFDGYSATFDGYTLLVN